MRFPLCVLALALAVPAAADPPAYRVLAQDNGHVAIVGPDGKVEWEVECKYNSHDIHMLPNGNLLLHTGPAPTGIVVGNFHGSSKGSGSTELWDIAVSHMGSGSVGRGVSHYRYSATRSRPSPADSQYLVSRRSGHLRALLGTGQWRLDPSDSRDRQAADV